MNEAGETVAASLAKHCADRAGPECAQGAIAGAVDGAEADPARGPGRLLG